MEINNEEKIIITIRMIRSFEFRNLKNLVIKDLNPNEMTVQMLKDKIINDVKTSNLPLPFKTFAYDMLKIEHFPFKAKTNDPVINCEDDEKLILVDSNRKLSDYNIINETEISFFKMEDYVKYKKDKTIRLE